MVKEEYAGDEKVPYLVYNHSVIQHYYECLSEICTHEEERYNILT